MDEHRKKPMPTLAEVRQARLAELRTRLDDPEDPTPSAATCKHCGTDLNGSAKCWRCKKSAR